MPKRFLCDQMCLELGKWLRIAGYDCSVDIPIEDQEIFQKAINENRFLITRDRHFIEIDRERKVVIYLKGNFIEEWVKQLKEEIEINWLYHPFSRCIKCNSILVKVNSADVPNQIPDQIKKTTNDFWSCPHCKQIYWLGSHTDSMLQKLKSWEEE